MDIGLDEGPWLLQTDELNHSDLQKYRDLDVNTTAVGGGNSIDNVFSVLAATLRRWQPGYVG